MMTRRKTRTLTVVRRAKSTRHVDGDLILVNDNRPGGGYLVEFCRTCWLRIGRWSAPALRGGRAPLMFVVGP